MSLLGTDTHHGDSRSSWCLTRRRPYTIDTDGNVTFTDPVRVAIDHESCRYAGCSCPCGHPGREKTP